MEKDEYWETFMTSGSVADYLRFKQSERDGIKQIPQDTDLRAVREEAGGFRDRVEHNAGFY